MVHQGEIAGRRVADVVAWRVDPTPWPRRVVGAGKLALGTALGLELGSAVSDFPQELSRATVPADDDVPIEVLHASGEAPWLPGAVAQGGVLVDLFRSRALWQQETPSGEPVDVPLRGLRIESATCRRPERLRQADTPWSVVVVGPGTRLDLVGSWLALAWAGHLAGWPEPVHRPEAGTPAGSPAPVRS